MSNDINPTDEVFEDEIGPGEDMPEDVLSMEQQKEEAK